MFINYVRRKCRADAATRSASTDLSSTTATAVPKHGGRSTSFHQLRLCAKSSSTARLCRDPATSLPTRRLLGHRATNRPYRVEWPRRPSTQYGLFVECLRSTSATAVPTKFVQALFIAMLRSSRIGCLFFMMSFFTVL